MKNSFFAFGTRYCGFDEMKEWFPFETIYCNIKNFSKIKHKSLNHSLYFFPETSLLYHNDLILTPKKGNYIKTIIIYRDLTDVIEIILEKTRINVDEVIKKQISLFEEYTNELIGETSNILEPYFMPIFYDMWRQDIKYRNSIAEALGFVNKDNTIYHAHHNYKLRQGIRFKRQITSQVKDLNRRI
jgi:hypothetical protein